MGLWRCTAVFERGTGVKRLRYAPQRAGSCPGVWRGTLRIKLQARAPLISLNEMKGYDLTYISATLGLETLGLEVAQTAITRATE